MYLDGCNARLHQQRQGGGRHHPHHVHDVYCIKGVRLAQEVLLGWFVKLRNIVFAVVPNSLLCYQRVDNEVAAYQGA